MKQLSVVILLVVLSIITPAATRAEAVCACYYGENENCEYYFDEDGVSFPTSRNECNLWCLEADNHPDTTRIDWAQDSDSEAGIDVGANCLLAEEQATEAAAVASATSSASTAAVTPSYPTPQLEIPIPEVDFVKPALEAGVLSSNFIGTYVSGVYKFLIGFAFVIAVVMIMIGGLQYVIGASTGEIGKAKERIKNAVVGFVLLLFVYVILFTVNPNLTVFEELAIEVILPVPEEEEDDFITGASVATSFSTPSGTGITGAGKTQIPAELAADIDSVAAKMNSFGLGISIASSFRSVEKQKELIAKNCQNPPGSTTCNPKTGKPTTCILKDLDPANCPHTTGRALDIWGTRSGIQCISQKKCLADVDACRADPCQAALISAMNAAGFCNLESEPWHFEKPKMSSRCN
jgi:hypothetical protein